MLIGITGLSGARRARSYAPTGQQGTLCAGKEIVCEWLVERHHCQRIELITSYSNDDNNNNNDDDCDGDSGSSRGPMVGTRIGGNPRRMTVGEIMAFLMEDRNWERNFVVSPVNHQRDLDVLKKRPFFQLLAVDAPLQCRYTRFLAKYASSSRSSTTTNIHANINTTTHTTSTTKATAETPWEEFMKRTDHQTTLLRDASQILHNPYTTEQELRTYLERLQPVDVLSPLRCRPSWDDYFMLLADLAAFRSNCMKRRVGCLLVRDHRVIATGYNGTPRGLPNCNEGGCGRCNDGAANNTLLEECLCMHAEENALLEAGRERVVGSHGDRTIVYCNTSPCLGCAKKMIQVGVHEIVYRLEYGMDTRVKDILKQAGILVRQHHPTTQLHLRCE